MGTEDMRRQAPNVQRMGLLGARVAPVDAGARTLKEAVSATIRDWVSNVGDTHYVIGSCVGPAPFPALVRDLQRIIGDEARAQILEKTGRAARPRDRLRRRRLERDRHLRPVRRATRASQLIGAEAAGEGIETGRHGAPLTVGGRGGVLHGAYSAIMQDEDGQILEAHSISAGLDYPGTGPEHAWLRDTGRARYDAVTDDEALDAFQRLAELEGIIPALESAHAVAWVLGAGPRDRDRGDDRPDLPVRPRRQGPRRGARQARAERRRRDTRRRPDRRGVRRRARPRGADAVPDGRLPGRRDLGRGSAIAYADAGADLVELGVPFRDPLADGPVIHAAATKALAAGATCTRSWRPARGSPSTSRSCSCVTPTRSSRAGPERFAASSPSAASAG